MPLNLRALLLSLCLIASAAAAAAAPSPNTLRVAVFGDSITRAVLADQSLGERASLGATFDFGRLAVNGAVGGYYPDSEGVLSYKLMSANSYLARDELAAIQGKTSWSMISRLEKELGYQVELVNAAKLGGSFRMGDVQLAAMEQEMKNRGIEDLDLVIIDLGRIDLTIYSSAEEFAQNVDEFFNQILKMSPSAHFLIMKIPNIPSSISRENRVSTEFFNKFQLTCEQIFTSGGVATKLGLSPGKSNPEAFKKAIERLNAFNAYLAKKVADYRAAGLSIDLAEGLADRVRADDWDIVMASDCIHVNQVGQHEIANAVWPHVKALLQEQATRVIAAEINTRPTGLSDQALALWQSYVDSVPVDQVQADCKPRMIPSTGTYKGVVVLFHGFTACAQQFYALGAELSAAGYTVLLPLNPGHGRLYSTLDGKNTDDSSPLPTGRANDSNSYLNYFKFVEQINKVAAAFGGERVVGGLSLGAAMASYATIHDPYLWDRQLIMSPLYELDQAAVHGFMGTLSNLNNLNSKVGSWLEPILQREQGWGQGCENERTPSWVKQFGRAGTRAGICQFKITHVLASNQFGYDVWSLLQPTRIKTQFVAVEDDPVINKQLVFTGVGRIRGESLQSKAFTTLERLDLNERARICYVPSSNMTCASNLKKTLGQQEWHCANHSLLSRFDAPNQNKYWINILQPKLVNFITKGEFLPAAAERAHNDPLCADFPQ